MSVKLVTLKVNYVFQPLKWNNLLLKLIYQVLRISLEWGEFSEAVTIWCLCKRNEVWLSKAEYWMQKYDDCRNKGLAHFETLIGWTVQVQVLISSPWSICTIFLQYLSYTWMPERYQNRKSDSVTPISNVFQWLHIIFWVNFFNFLEFIIAMISFFSKIRLEKMLCIYTDILTCWIHWNRPF